MNYIAKNWKTSLSGAIIIALGALNTFLGLHVPGFNLDFTAALAAGVGLILARDGDLTGGTKSVSALLVALAIAAAVAPGDARAQASMVAAVSRGGPQAKPLLTGNIVQDVQNAVSGGTAKKLSPNELWQKIVNASVADLTYSKALADNVGSAGSRLRSVCYAAWITTVEQANGANLKDASGAPLTKPDPALFALFEQIAEVADNLQPTSPFMAACTPAANAFKMTVAELVTMTVTGAASLAALGITLP